MCIFSRRLSEILVYFLVLNYSYTPCLAAFKGKIMSQFPNGTVDLDGVSIESWLVMFDKKGRCENPASRDALLVRLRELDKKTPVILFSHGWNNGYREAVAKYTNFLREFEVLHKSQKAAPGFENKPIFVGIVWPSIWFSLDDPPTAKVDSSLSQDSNAADEFLKEGIAINLIDLEERSRFQELYLRSELNEGESLEFADLAAKAIAYDISTGASEGAEAGLPDGQAILSAAIDLQSNKIVVYNDDGSAQTSGLFSALDPRNLARVASVYQMKDRAGVVGRIGVSMLLSGMLKNTSFPLYLIGHSFGAKVVLGGVAGQPLPRKITSILLMQPAISHLCFARKISGRHGPGAYWTTLSEDRVINPLYLTYSKADRPLHDLYHLALRRSQDLGDVKVFSSNKPSASIGCAGNTSAGDPPSKYCALGGYGPRDVDEGYCLVKEFPSPEGKFTEPKGVRVVGFDGSLSNKIVAHGDVFKKDTAWLLCYLIQNANN